MTKKRTTGLVPALLGLLLSGLSLPAAAAANKDVRAAVMLLLSGYEPADPGAALRRLGPAAADALLSIAKDPATSPIRRLRAIEALGHVPTPAGQAYLQEVLRTRQGATDSLSVFELAAAARALGGFGPAVIGDLVPLLEHQSADVREGTIAALSRLHTEPASRVLRARLSVERDPGARAALLQALRPAAR